MARNHYTERSERDAVNRTLIEPIAGGHRGQAQLESGEHASLPRATPRGLEDLAKHVGYDRT